MIRLGCAVFATNDDIDISVPSESRVVANVVDVVDDDVDADGSVSTVIVVGMQSDDDDVDDPKDDVVALLL